MAELVTPKIQTVESKGSYGRFSAEPLEKGIGVTIGNMLRRMLLGYLPGAAVTHIRIEGILHEFSTIPNVKEDTVEFLLNIKQLRLKAVSGQPGTLVLDVQREGPVYAADIKPSTDFEIANPDLYLVTLDSPGAKMYVEMDIELGEGYHPAKSRNSLPIGTIPVDAIFTPVRKVNFSVEPVHTGRETTHERLYLDIWTDNTISPLDALSYAADALIKQLIPFAEYAHESQKTVEKKHVHLAIPEEQYNMPVENLDLSVRTLNALRRGGITTVGELISKGEKELLSLRNFGQKSKQEIEERLKIMGLSLSPPAEEQPQEQVEPTE